MAFAISVGFLGLFIAFSLLGERALQDSVNRILQERQVIAELTARQYDQRLTDVLNILGRTRNLASFDPNSHDLSTETSILRDSIASHPALRSGMAILDMQGIVVLAQPLELYQTGSNLSANPAIRPRLMEAGPTLSSPFLHPTAGPVIAAILPVWSGEQRLGYLIGLLSLESTFFTEPLGVAAEISQTGHAVLFNAQGDVLVSTIGLPFLSPGEHHTFYASAISAGVSTVMSVPFELEVEGEPYEHLHTMAFAPLSQVTWGVAVGGDTEETFGGVSRLRAGLALLGVISLLATWGITLLGARTLVGPVHRMTEAAQLIAGGSLNTPISASEGGEITKLAEALERMRLQLLDQINDAEEWNKILERRVADRSRELQSQRERAYQLLQHAMRAQEDERSRLARELHDEIGQSLTAIRLSLDHLHHSLPVDDSQLHNRYQETEKTLERAIQDLRRIMAALRPGVLDELGLVSALQWLADHQLKPHDIGVRIDPGDMNLRLPEEVETTLFRIAQEAFNNILQHSQANHVDLHLTMLNGEVHLVIQDDGHGFDREGVHVGASPQVNFGIAGMEERAALLGGRLVVESHLGGGTRVFAAIPVSSHVLGKAAR